VVGGGWGWCGGLVLMVMAVAVVMGSNVMS
jgi:hypothetical protein